MDDNFLFRSDHLQKLTEKFSQEVRTKSKLTDESNCPDNLTEKFSQAQRFTINEKLSIEEIASAIGAPEEVEMVFKLMEHASANMDHPIKKIPADPPFRSQYQYVP